MFVIYFAINIGELHIQSTKRRGFFLCLGVIFKRETAGNFFCNGTCNPVIRWVVFRRFFKVGITGNSFLCVAQVLTG
jgi:hypothetical protein